MPVVLKGKNRKQGLEGPFRLSEGRIWIKMAFRGERRRPKKAVNCLFGVRKVLSKPDPSISILKWHQRNNTPWNLISFVWVHVLSYILVNNFFSTLVKATLVESVIWVSLKIYNAYINSEKAFWILLDGGWCVNLIFSLRFRVHCSGSWQFFILNFRS